MRTDAFSSIQGRLEKGKQPEARLKEKPLIESAKARAMSSSQVPPVGPPTRESSYKRQPWIASAGVDLLLILSPPFLSVLVVILCRNSFRGKAEVPLWAWVSLVLCIDVAHVYSSLFRTYFHKAEFKKHKRLLVLVPLFAWIIGVSLYSISAALFWRILAYVAVFHFIRQQYGFMMLYSRQEDATQRRWKWLDKGLIYLATLYPLAHWHTHLPKNFHWFVEGDFVSGTPRWVGSVVFWLYFVFFLLYAGKELLFFQQKRPFSIPKQLILLGTALSWYVGIVMLNGDMAFTITNIVSHGIPYMGLIWIYGKKQSIASPQTKVFSQVSYKQIFSIAMIPVFLGILWLFAYIEEGLWSGLVFRERLSFFRFFTLLPKLSDPWLLALVVPLLSLPQMTHYVVDGFLWKLRKPDAAWKQIVFTKEGQLK